MRGFMSWQKWSVPPPRDSSVNLWLPSVEDDSALKNWCHVTCVHTTTFQFSCTPMVHLTNTLGSNFKSISTVRTLSTYFPRSQIRDTSSLRFTWLNGPTIKRRLSLFSLTCLIIPICILKWTNTHYDSYCDHGGCCHDQCVYGHVCLISMTTLNYTTHLIQCGPHYASLTHINCLLIPG